MKNEFIVELKKLNLEPMSGEAFLKFMSENELIKEFRAKSGGKIGENAYNEILRVCLSIEAKLELLYLDLVDYVEAELGAEKMEAIENIINIFKKNPYPWSIDDEIEVILYGYNNFKNKYDTIKYYKVIVDDIIDTEQVGNETLRAVIDKYYSYFYQDLEKSLNNIIDNYNQVGECLGYKLNELIDNKGENDE